MTDLRNSIHIAAAGMQAQSKRLEVAAENIANAESTGSTPGADPYSRKTISFKNVLNEQLGVELVEVDHVGVDKSPFVLQYDPSHPAADETGYVKLPNVNKMLEMQDMKQAQRSYEANLNSIEITKKMLTQTLDLLR